MEYFNTINQDEDAQVKTTTFSLFNRSFSMPPTSTHEITKKPLLQSCDRNGSIKSLTNSTSLGTTFVRGKVKKLCSIFDKKTSKSLTLSKLSVSETAPGASSALEGRYLPGTEGKVVIYFTSLRGIRRTFLDCGYVLMIMRGFRIELDERDVSMHLAYRKELENVLISSGSISITLPHVFINGKYIGGAELIRQLNETGQLANMVRGIPVRRTTNACNECGDIRFVPCLNCNGSRKVFDEDEERVDRCPDCNENGLMQCPICNVS